MKLRDMPQYSIPFYLVIVLTIFLPHNSWSLILITIPVGLILLGIYNKTFIASFLGLSFFSLITLTFLPIITLNDYLLTYTQVLLLLFPCLLLMNQMLQHHDITKVFQKEQRIYSSLILTICLFIFILLLVYSSRYFVAHTSIFSIDIESVQAQILLIISCTLGVVSFFLLKPIKLKTSVEE